jgi:hypothetical protein
MFLGVDDAHCAGGPSGRTTVLMDWTFLNYAPLTQVYAWLAHPFPRLSYNANNCSQTTDWGRGRRGVNDFAALDRCRVRHGVTEILRGLYTNLI